VFDEDLKFKYTQNISLENSRTYLAGVFSADNQINIYYTYADDNGRNLKVKSFNEEGAPIDTVLLAYEKGDLFRKAIGSAISEDNSKLVLYRYFDNNLHYFIIDNIAKEVIVYNTIPKGAHQLDRGVEEAMISNSGEVFFVLRTKFDFGRDDNTVALLNVNIIGDIKPINIEFLDFFSQRIEIEIDNINNHLVMAGLLEFEDEFQSSHYFLINEGFENLGESILIEPITISSNMFLKAQGKVNNDKPQLESFFINKLLLRKDGGVIIFGENQRTVYRRSVYSNNRQFGFRDPGSYRNLTDYYHENIIVLNINPDGTKAWEEILPKQQYSQDDGGYFSSYFVFTTPSRIRVLYSDEIKANSTMSEYVIDPLGHFERNSVLSTEYQDLRLRIKDATQISNSEIVVPSEKSGKINLVKIKF
jgi:hypothetical protein